MTPYSPDLTLQDARTLYFQRNGFGEDGRYHEPWVTYRLGPVPFPFPNTPARVRAIRYHDLHHVLTGYETDFTGEMEIGAWEIATGCTAFPAALHLNLAAVGAGVLLAPVRTLRAFARGRSSRNLYGLEFGDELLSRAVGDTRAALGIQDGPSTSLGVMDVLRFIPVASVALCVTFTTLILATPLAVLVWPWLVLAKPRATS